MAKQKNLEKLLRLGNSIRSSCVSAVAAAGLACGIAGCELYDDNKPSEQPKPYYPADTAKSGDLLCSTNDAFFSKNYVGIANFPIYPRDVFDATWLVGNNGFQVFQGHNGGYGDTFQIVSRDAGIYMCWAYGDICNISLFGNWAGKVYEGDIRLGDPIEKFLQAYPNSRKENPDSRYPSSFYSQYAGHAEESRTEEFQYAILTNRDNSVSRGFMCLSADADAGGKINCIRLDYDWRDE